MSRKKAKTKAKKKKRCNHRLVNWYSPMGEVVERACRCGLRHG
jgi:hypothetical protein